MTARWRATASASARDRVIGANAVARPTGALEMAVDSGSEADARTRAPWFGLSAKLLVLSGEPINEPVYSQGPFVMNTADEIREAIADYRSGRMGTLA